MTRSLLAVVVLLLASTTACLDDFDPPALVVKNRPLAAHTEVLGDATAAWPAPGDAVRVTWLMADVGEPRPMTWAFLACPAIVAPTGDRFCVAAPFAVARATEPSVDAPFLAFTTPGADALSGAGLVLVQGIICADGVAAVDLATMDARCEGDAPVTSRVESTVRVSLDGSTNHHPVLAADAITLDAAPWSPPVDEAPASGCGAVDGTPELPRLSVASTSDDPEVRLLPGAADRESYLTEDASTAVEDLVYSSFSNAGKLDRQFTVVDDEHPDARVSYALPKPPDVPSDGLTVRFWFVVRDGRGGTAWTRRALCVVP